MKRIEARLADRRVRWLCLLAIVAVALGARLPLAAMAEHPGHADPSFYYTLAANIAEGRGLVIDYIWHFLGDVDAAGAGAGAGAGALSHPANDYWPPLASLIMSVPLSLLGHSLFAALLPGALCGAALAGLGYAAARAYGCSPLYALSAGVLATFCPNAFIYSLRTEATIYSALIVGAALLCAIRGMRDARWQLPAFGLAALAPPTRQDGFLLLPVLLVAVAMSAGTRRQRARRALAGLGVYALLLLPYLLLNLWTLGRPLPPGLSKTIFLTEYEDIYAYGKELSWRTYRAWGWEAIARSKLLAGWDHLTRIAILLGPILTALLLVGLVDVAIPRRRPERWRLYAPPLLLLGVLLLAHALIYTIPSTSASFARSLLALAPFLIAIGVAALERLARGSGKAALLLWLAAALYLHAGAAEALDYVEDDARRGARLHALRDVLVEDARAWGQSDVVVMTRNPWEVHESTRFRAVQIPNNDRGTILHVAERFEANYLLLPAPRPALAALAHDPGGDPRFAFVAEVPGAKMEVFRILPP